MLHIVEEELFLVAYSSFLKASASVLGGVFSWKNKTIYQYLFIIAGMLFAVFITNCLKSFIIPNFKFYLKV